MPFLSAHELKVYLHSFYKELDLNMFTRTNISETYGEVLFDGIEKIITQIKLEDSEVIYDLGSGLGKVLIQIALQYHVKKLVGIELNEKINATANDVIQEIKHDSKIKPKQINNLANIQFKAGSFFDIPFNDASVIFIFSTCFTKTMLYQLGDLINSIPSIRTVLTLKPIFNLQLPFVKSFRVECTWDSALCYMYQKLN